MATQKKRKTKRAVPKNRTVGDMQRFFKSLDLASLWADFYVSISSSGRPKYKTSKQFARQIGENERQIGFLIWLFGPDDNPEANAQFPFIKPLDFDKKRATEGWFTDENIRAYFQVMCEVRSMHLKRCGPPAMALRSIRWRVWRTFLARRLDEDFSGRFLCRRVIVQGEPGTRPFLLGDA